MKHTQIQIYCKNDENLLSVMFFSAYGGFVPRAPLGNQGPSDVSSYAPLFCSFRLCSGGAKVGPAGTRALAVKTCAPAVPRQLAGRWAERVERVD